MMVNYDGGLSKLSPSARTALEYAANVIQQDHWLKCGDTSLFWHLVGTAASHIEGRKGEGVMDVTIEPGYYRHFKGHKYYVIGVSTHSETLVKEVVYHRVGQPDELWHRPYEMFTSSTPEGKPRFEFLGSNDVGD